MSKWQKIENSQTPANNLRFMLSGRLCIGLKFSQTMTFDVKTNSKHDALKINYDTKTQDFFQECLDKEKEYFNFQIESIDSHCVIIKNIQEL